MIKNAVKTYKYNFTSLLLLILRKKLHITSYFKNIISKHKTLHFISLVTIYRNLTGVNCRNLTLTKNDKKLHKIENVSL